MAAAAATTACKVPKGARDAVGGQVAARDAVVSIVRGVCRRHGAEEMDTPVFERRDTLTGKYGEDAKLIYDLADQGGELLSLRYDLTVPFARHLATSGRSSMTRFQAGKVYRRDQPQPARGRFREFTQCDFDVAGSHPSMVADAEVIKVVTEVLAELAPAAGGFEVRVSHRGLLDAVLAAAGVPAGLVRPVCSAIDKLDKVPWETVRRELVEAKGVPGAVADRVREMVSMRGEPTELISRLSELAHLSAAAPLAELTDLFAYLRAMEGMRNVVLDLSLARGLDYYTGPVFEAVLLPDNGVGSVAAGGRYDGLVGSLNGGRDVPAVGASFGVDRIVASMELRVKNSPLPALLQALPHVLVASAGEGMQVGRMEVCALLWAAGIRAEFGYKANHRMASQFALALERGVPIVVLFGETELRDGCVKVRDMAARTEVTLPRTDMVTYLLALPRMASPL